MSQFDRQSFLGDQSEHVFRNLMIGIAGLGGGGSHAAQQAAHVGVGCQLLMDPDIIDDTNLNRLVGGTVADVKARRPKVNIARRVIRSVNPATKIVARQAKWQECLDDLKHCDVVIGCLDKVTAKNDLDAFCRRYLIPYIDIGMDVNAIEQGFMISGQVVLSMPDGPCLQCYGVVQQSALAAEGRRYGDAGGRPQVVWPNGVLASTAIGLLIQLVCPWHKHIGNHAYLEYDGNRGTVSESNRLPLVLRRPCVHRLQNERGDAGFDVRLARRIGN